MFLRTSPGIRGESTFCAKNFEAVLLRARSFAASIEIEQPDLFASKLIQRRDSAVAIQDHGGNAFNGRWPSAHFGAMPPHISVEPRLSVFSMYWL